MSAIATTPQLSWAAGHRTMLIVLAAVLAVLVAVSVAVVLAGGTSGDGATYRPGGENSCSGTLLGAC